MLKVKLNYIRGLAEEINRLYRLEEQMQKSKDSEKIREFYINIKWCKDEYNRMVSEKLLEHMELSLEERSMAENYYYKAMTWREAFENSALFYEKIDVDNDEMIDRMISTYKKYIERAVQKYIKY